MSTFTAKAGDTLASLEVALIDRTGAPLDLTNATSVYIYMRDDHATTNELDGVACSVQSPATDGLITGPNAVLDTAGEYSAYFKVNYGSTAYRVPSQDVIRIRVEESFE